VIDSVDATSALGATITQEADGTLRYDPSSIMDNLSEGQVVEDTFTYTIKDAGEETSTATVTVSVSGVNEDPTAEDDVLATTEDTPLTFDPLADHGNGVDSDPDMNDVLSVSEFDAVSANGATITFMDGMFTYDPSTSATLQALLEGDDPRYVPIRNFRRPCRHGDGHRVGDRFRTLRSFFPHH
jgi:VCBS repeat-containing protein